MFKNLNHIVLGFLPILIFILFPSSITASENLIRISGYGAGRTRFVLASENGGPPPGFYYSTMSRLYTSLLSETNYGSDGIVSCDISGLDNLVTYVEEGSLVSNEGSLIVDVFWGPPIDTDLSEEEATELARFVQNGGVLYVGGVGWQDSTPGRGSEYNLLFEKLSIEDHFDEYAPAGGLQEINLGSQSIVTNGPFGNITSITLNSFRKFNKNTLRGLAYKDEGFVIHEGRIGKGYVAVVGSPLFTNGSVVYNDNNLNYFLNLFSLGCRDDWRSNAVVLDVPSFKQGSDETNPEWGEIIYDSGDTLKLECDLDNNGATMRECGCALSAAAMVMNYLGVKTSHTGLSVNPGALNIIYRYFPKPDAPPYGFINGLVNWFAVSNLSALAHQAYPTQPKLELPVRENYSYERIVQYIERGIPVILRVNNGSHWVVVKGYDPDTQRLVINDPAYADPPIGLFTYLDERYIPDTINSMIVYTPTQSDFRYIQVAAEEGIDLTLTDAGGNNLSNAEYVFERNYINPSLSSLGSAGGYHIFTFKLPDDGDYLVSSTGNFYVYTSDTEGNMVGKEVNQSAERKTYKLTYFEASAGEGIHIQEMVNEPEVLEVQIDVRPWSRWDWLFLKGLLPVPVTIFSSHEFDATSIDENTLLLGVTGTEDSLYGCQRWDFDLNRDRRKDKLCWFNARKMGLKKSTSEIILTGIAGDTPILGYDTVKVY